MASYVTKVDQEDGPDLFGMWSDTVDLPMTILMPEEEFREWYCEYYERDLHHTEKPEDVIDDRIDRARETGVSYLYGERSDILSVNDYEPRGEVSGQEAAERWLEKTRSIRQETDYTNRDKLI